MWSEGLTFALGADVYSDRMRSAQATVAAMRPHFAELGITRVARQTRLDRIGIPCFAAFRPNAQSLSMSAGKGLTDHAAMASAVMEAAEYAIAERVAPAFRASPRELDGATMFDPSRMLPMGSRLDPELRIDWVMGSDLATGAPSLVPFEIVSLATLSPQLAGLSRSTNGLASGNTHEEAVFHAISELVERDATTLWSLKTLDDQLAQAIDPQRFDDPVVEALTAMVESAGLVLRLFDLTSDLPIPTIMALIGPHDGGSYFELASGTGTHPVAARAAIRAITEAAQSRVTTIAGSGDDLDDLAFGAPAVPAARALLAANPVGSPTRGLATGTPLQALSEWSRNILIDAGIDATIVPLDAARFGVHAVRAVSVQLEDREANRNWRPGRRSVARLLQVAA